MAATSDRAKCPARLDEPKALRRLLVRGLRKEGYRNLCKEEPSDFTLAGELVSVSLFCSVVLGLGIFAVHQLGWTIWMSISALVLALVGAAAVTALAKAPAVPYALFVLLWAATGIAQVVGPGLEALLLTHALPFVLVLGARWGWRALRLAADIPLFVPVAFIVVFSPLLSEDPWTLSARAAWQLAALAAVAIVSLLGLVVARLLRISVPAAFVTAAERLTEARERDQEALKLLKKLGREEDEERLDEERAVKRVRTAYEAPFAEHARQIAERIGRAFKTRAILRLIPLTVGIGSSIWGLTYILAWAAVPASLAAEWSGRRVPTEELALPGFEVSLPLGPYLTLAALLAIVATVGFLALALSEDRYSTALSEALVSRPAERCLLLALPYVTLKEPKKRSSWSDRRRAEAEGEDAKGKRG